MPCRSSQPLAPKLKGTKILPLVATIEIDIENNAMTGYAVAGLKKGAGGITVTMSANTYTIKIEGLESGSKYTLWAQAVSGEQYSKATKFAAAALKYAVPKISSKAEAGSGSVTLRWNTSVTHPSTEATYRVGIYDAKTKAFLFAGDEGKIVCKFAHRRVSLAGVPAARYNVSADNIRAKVPQKAKDTRKPKIQWYWRYMVLEI